MAELTSTKPYMIRAIHEWCTDNGLTPHLLVAVNSQTRVPMAYVKDGQIVLNINYSATKSLHIGSDAVTFSARFGGASNELYVPIDAVRRIFARENGEGMFFQEDPQGSDPDNTDAKSSNADAGNAHPPVVKKPSLKVVK
ncbi:ClpXP protease specificity-enhancing factor [Methylobacillus gramineus]|uniref:ClpXP protease specificity-enhancing factor n=1 Tax=Methylobacillus gramineus TaxID=755169 RepID=UPI001CFFEB3C|nr:ClpXP protease specificity-enhancing factor [Methylobacillus gramineus]MCB5185647.1 ClpXP protease specificity-enhancing factor [Methylobacillus gramineus]